MSSVRIQVEPMETWAYRETDRDKRVRSPFTGSYASTLDVLDRELFQLRAKAVAMRVVTTARNIRSDGMLRADAKIEHPGVALAFMSKNGPLEVFCDKFTGTYSAPGWQWNLRALAFGLEAARKMDRYGIGGSGNQYTGWLQIEGPKAGRAEALARLAEIGEVSPDEDDRSIVRAAKMHAHPDRHGGRRELWDEVVHTLVPAI